MIVAVIDSTCAGTDAGVTLGGDPLGIPVVHSLDEAFTVASRSPGGPVAAPEKLGVFIFGLAPLSGLMSKTDRRAVLDAVGNGLDVVSGLHEFLDPRSASHHLLVEAIELHMQRAARRDRDLRPDRRRASRA